MCFLMWLGRMEFILVLILFTKGFWSDVRLSVGQYRSARATNMLASKFNKKR